jgi:DNA polymerase I-like protein with 3'-5' exonuclease and polymerase domains
MTARMAHTGLRFDPVQIERLTEEHLEAKAAHAEHVQAFGIENAGSDQQVGAALVGLGAQLPRTTTGRPSVAAGVLEPFRMIEGPVGELASAVLDYRHHKTALSLFLEPWGALVRRGDGRARSTIYTLAADTGRMSSVRFNFQQISREGGLRSCITADPGYLLASADFAGVELRTGAGLSQDRNLIAMLEQGVDPHMEIAKLVWGPGATKANRYKAKPMVFGRMYGSGAPGLARSNGVSEAVARQVIEAMDQLTPGLSEWSRQVRNSIESGRTQFPAYSGRIIHLPKQAPHAGPNYCIQGTARELLIDALLRWRQTRWGEATLMPVHDELVVMVPEDEATEATAALTECMTTNLFGVPIIAEERCV